MNKSVNDIVNVGDQIKFRSDDHKALYSIGYTENTNFMNFVNRLPSHVFTVESIAELYGITGVKGYMTERQGPVSVITMSEFEKYFEIVKKANPESKFDFNISKVVKFGDTCVTKENYKDFIESVRIIFED
ncbi:hypothetical protein BN80_012 [Yersinia phage phiR1-RT]|uniref:Uncharacterized protein n=1 Tax=Yersinia phage phiR1-RT TaxID=1206558 RepID=I7K2T7_BPPR1|nr:hypothetical protein BN80_012 [Yersinia phage phiR1-RT]CCI88586.1 hypothetical protein BN80_012 [Yersinia phage phiR1-RT]